MENSKHPFLPLTILDHNQPDPEFDEAFIDARSRVGALTVSSIPELMIIVVHFF